MTTGNSIHPFILRALIWILSALATITVLLVFPLLETTEPPHQIPKLPTSIPIRIAPSKHQPTETVQTQPAMTTTSYSRGDRATISLPTPLSPPPELLPPALPTEPVANPPETQAQVEQIELPTETKEQQKEEQTVKVPVAEVPMVEEPVTAEPTLEAPAAEVPVAEAPVAEAPVAEATSEESPIASDAQSGNKPSQESTGDTSSASDMTGMVLPEGQSLKHPPHPLKRVSPRYPERCRRLNIEGFVVLRFTIDAHGIVTEPSVHQSTPPEVFDNAALRAIRQWRFEPGRDDTGKPIPCRLQLRIDFKMED